MAPCFTSFRAFEWFTLTFEVSSALLSGCFKFVGTARLTGSDGEVLAGRGIELFFSSGLRTRPRAARGTIGDFGVCGETLRWAWTGPPGFGGSGVLFGEVGGDVDRLGVIGDARVV